MQISWFTVIAQVINFILLVWLLKRFLYKPVLKAIDEREKKIVKRLEDAEAKKSEAQKQQEDFTQKTKAFDKKKKELMDTAIAEVGKQKESLLEDARKSVDILHRKQKKAIIDTQESFKKEIAKKTQQEVFDISRKALSDIASEDLEIKVAGLFIGRIQNLNDEAKQQFNDAFKSDSVPVVVQSAFELKADQQQEIKDAVIEILGNKATFQFKTVPDIICGIELIANGYKLEWSISAWLNILQTNVSETSKKAERGNELQHQY